MAKVFKTSENLTTPENVGVSHAAIFRQLAEESLAAAEAEHSLRIDELEGERSGVVIRFDPEWRSFKHAIVAIVFAGMYIESRLWVVGCHRLGADQYRRVDRQPLEERIKALGITDERLVMDCRRYREARKGLVHEKPLPVELDRSPLRIAQDEASFAVTLMSRVDSELAND